MGETRACNDTLFGPYAVYMCKSNIDLCNNATLTYALSCKHMKALEGLPADLKIRTFLSVFRIHILKEKKIVFKLV